MLLCLFLFQGGLFRRQVRSCPLPVLSALSAQQQAGSITVKSGPGRRHKQGSPSLHCLQAGSPLPRHGFSCPTPRPTRLQCHKICTASHCPPDGMANCSLMLCLLPCCIFSNNVLFVFRGFSPDYLREVEFFFFWRGGEERGTEERLEFFSQNTDLEGSSFLVCLDG